MLICMLASLVAIRMALRIDPAEAIGDNMTHGILIEGLKKRFGQGDNAFYALKRCQYAGCTR